MQTFASKNPTKLMLGLALALLPAAAMAQPTNGGGFTSRDGEQLYRAICQGCHMADGKGAQGAGMYPALAGNPRLAAGLYAALVVRQGKNGMPPVGNFLDDEQVAAVVNFVRTHFGNTYQDALTADDVKKLGKRP
jgi:mono/diheme cytochrome c family protein